MKISSIVAAFGFLLCGTSFAQECFKEDISWRSEAKTHLTKEGLPVTDEILDQHEYLRCIRMNNYVCMMHSSPNDPWNGSEGRHECAIGDNGHAVFVEAKWSIRSMVRDLCSKHRGRPDREPARSALAVVEIRTPWCDTLGSVSSRLGYGRTCESGPVPTEGEWASLERCEKPETGTASAEQCAACNCPDKVAGRLVRGMGISATDDMELFDDQGNPNKSNIKIVLSNIVADETGGMRPTDEILDAGIELAGTCSPR